MLGKWTRRRFLSAAGVGAGAALLAYLPLLSVTAQEVGSPRRLVLFSSPNGTNLHRWRGTGADALPDRVGTHALGRLTGQILSPLDSLIPRLTLIDGLDIESGYQRNDGGTLQKGHSASCLLWSGARGGPLVSDDAGWSRDPSIDHVAAEHIGADRPVQVLHLGTWSQGSLIPELIYSHDAPLHPFPARTNPIAVFDQLWGGGPTPEDTVDAARARRRRMLAQVRSDLVRLREQLVVEDRMRVEAHIEALDTLRARIDAAAELSCTAPDRSGFRSTDNSEQNVATDLMLEIGRLALACDLTRVFHFQFSREGNGGGAAFIRDFGASNIHSVSHQTNEAADGGRNRIAALHAWIAGRFGQFFESLGPLADNTLAVWGQTMSHGGAHNSRCVPFAVLQGSAIDHFRAGHYVRTTDYVQPPDGGGGGYARSEAPPHNHLLASICQALGIAADRVGEPSLPGGPLAGWMA